METSVLLGQNLRTFAQRSPMFLISETQHGGTNIQDVCFEDDNDAIEVMDAGGKSTGSVESFYR